MTGRCIHIYRVASQPAHRYVVDFGDKVGRHWFRLTRRQLVWCMCCNRKRQAGNSTAQVYYDGTRFFCRKGRGCKK